MVEFLLFLIIGFMISATINVALLTNSKGMKEYNNYNVDNWRAEERYISSYNALKENNHNFSIDDFSNYKRSLIDSYIHTLDK